MPGLLFAVFFSPILSKGFAFVVVGGVFVVMKVVPVNYLNFLLYFSHFLFTLHDIRLCVHLFAPVWSIFLTCNGCAFVHGGSVRLPARTWPPYRLCNPLVAATCGIEHR